MTTYYDLLDEIVARSRAICSREQVDQMVTEAAAVQGLSAVMVAEDLIDVLDAYAGPFVDAIVRETKLSGHTEQEWKQLRRQVLQMGGEVLWQT